MCSISAPPSRPSLFSRSSSSSSFFLRVYFHSLRQSNSPALRDELFFHYRSFTALRDEQQAQHWAPWKSAIYSRRRRARERHIYLTRMIQLFSVLFIVTSFTLNRFSHHPLLSIKAGSFSLFPFATVTLTFLTSFSSGLFFPATFSLSRNHHTDSVFSRKNIMQLTLFSFCFLCDSLSLFCALSEMYSSKLSLSLFICMCSQFNSLILICTFLQLPL